MTDILQNVEQDKRKKWSRKFERYSEGEWNRNNFESKLDDVKQDIDGIEDIITGLQERRRKITGVPEEKSPDDLDKNDFDEIEGSYFDKQIQEFGADQFRSLLKKDLGGVNPTLKPLDEKRDELQEIRKKEAEWKTLQFELSNLALEKLQSIAVNYKEEYKSAEVARDFEKHAEQIVESKVQQAKSEIKQELEREVADLEQATNSARNEIKNAWAFLEKFAEEQEMSEEAVEITVQALEEGLEQLATEKGTVDLSGEQLEVDEKKREREAARESATSSVGLAKYELDGEDLEDQHSVLQRMSENESVLEMSLSEVAEMTDVSEDALEEILDDIEEEYGTRFGMD